MIKKMNLSWITVSDYKKAKQFFTETLGMKLADDVEEYKWMELEGSDGGSRLGIGEASGEGADRMQAGQNAVVTMSVDDIDQAKASLESKGVAILGDIIEIPGHVKLLMFADPDGNRFQLVQEFNNQ